MATRANSIFGCSDFRMSRRTFTKLTALGTAAALSGIGEVGAYPTKFVEKLIEPASAAPAPGVKLVKSNCSHCALGCGFLGRVEDGVCTGMEPWVENPINRGAMCSKGTAIPEMLNSETRLKYPMKKVGGKWVKISWNEALDEIANKMKEIKTTYGPDSIMYIGSAKVTNEECYLFRKFCSFQRHEQRRSPGKDMPFYDGRRHGEHMELWCYDELVERYAQLRVDLLLR